MFHQHHKSVKDYVYVTWKTKYQEFDRFWALWHCEKLYINFEI